MRYAKLASSKTVAMDRTWKSDGPFEYRNLHERGNSRPWLLRPVSSLERNCRQAEQIGNRARHPVFIVEGQFDGIKVARFGVTVAVIFGQPSIGKLDEILQMVVANRKQSVSFILLLDSDAAAKARQFHRELRRWGVRSFNATPLLPEGHDPDSCPEDDLGRIVGESQRRVALLE